MPGQPKQKAAGWAKTMFGSMLDELIGSGAQKVVETARQVAPKCAFCYSPTIVKCQACGRFVCRVHVFVNAVAVDRYNVICSDCISHHFDFVSVEPPPHYANYQHQHAQQEEARWPYPEQPWDILGINWYAQEEEIEAARKQKARQVHPDHASDEQDRVQREKAMKMVNAAAEYMLRHRRGQ